MKFCPECGGDLRGSAKFCPECGINLNNLSRDNSNQNDLPIELPEPVLEAEEQVIQKTTRDLGTRLEESVERIFKDRGYQTMRGQKIKGQSGQYNEIDVIAKRGSITLAVECKNYTEDRKVGIKEIRDFVAKLDDLNINKGLFVTSSDFSSDAIGWATNNPSSKQVDLWDGSTFMEQYKSVMLGRTNSKLSIIENTLQSKGTFEDYSILTLKNKDRITIKRRDLIFHPYYIVEFNLREQFKTPDRQIHTQQNSGRYFTDGLSGEILYSIDDKGHSPYDLDNMQKQIVRDLEELSPTTIEVTQEPNSKILKLDPSLNKKDIEFKVKTEIVKDNKAIIQYEVKISREKTEVKEYHHSPDINAITTRARLVYVPKMEIEFESKENTYSRIILPASDVVIKDDIALCRHKLGLQKKHTFAVCEVCGVAKCEKDILVDDKDLCYCKEHASAELKESNKGSSITDKFKRFRFGK
ncbi:MAG TPA: restriction endonuclease [Nitrosopumilaceae archaeon]|nr:restriction endonuclease [Nitrosopumilaceae archaeon]